MFYLLEFKFLEFIHWEFFKACTEAMLAQKFTLAFVRHLGYSKLMALHVFFIPLKFQAAYNIVPSYMSKTIRNENSRLLLIAFFRHILKAKNK